MKKQLLGFWLILVLISTSWQVSAFSGARAFSNPVYQPVDAYAKKLVVADFNGDGCDDMVTLHWEIDGRGQVSRQDDVTKIYGRVGLLAIRFADCAKAKTTNTAIFLPPQYIEFGSNPCPFDDNGGDYSLCTARYDNDIVVADMNGDGAPDLLALNAASKSISIFLNPKDGTGRFPPPTVLSTQDGNAQSCLGGNQRPTLLTAGDFDGDKLMDIAVEHDDDDCLASFADAFKFTGPTADITIYRNVLSGRTPLVYARDVYNSALDWDYDYHTPFYYKKYPIQLTTASLLGNGHTQLIAPLLINLTHYPPPIGSCAVLDFSGPTPTCMAVPLTPPITLADVDHNGLLDLVGDGGTSIFLQQNKGDLSTLISALAPKPPTAISKAVITADFDQDGQLDIATIQNTDELWIGYGDLAKKNPLNPFAPPMVRSDYRIAPPWSRNTYSMATGNFNGDSLARDPSKPLLDIATLGTDVVTIHLNAGNIVQLNLPALAQVTTLVKAGDTVQAIGQFWPYTVSEIQGFNFDGDDATTAAIHSTISRGQFTTFMHGPPDTLTFILPDVDTLPAGQYQVSVNNSGLKSSSIKVMVTGPVIPTIESIRPTSPALGQTFEVVGTAFGFTTPNAITSVRLLGTTGATMGVVLNLTAGSGAGQFEVLPPSGSKGHVMINLPTAGGTLIAGDYNLTLQNAKGRSSNFLLTIQ